MKPILMTLLMAISISASNAIKIDLEKLCKMPVCIQVEIIKHLENQIPEALFTRNLTTLYIGNNTYIQNKDRHIRSEDLGVNNGVARAKNIGAMIATEKIPLKELNGRFFTAREVLFLIFLYKHDNPINLMKVGNEQLAQVFNILSDELKTYLIDRYKISFKKEPEGSRCSSDAIYLDNVEIPREIWVEIYEGR